MKKFDEKTVIGRVKLLRQQFAGPRGRSEFARALGISPSTYSYYEHNRIPPMDLLLEMCKVTGTDLNWLLTGSQSPQQPFSGPNTAFLKKIDAIITENPEMTQSIAAFAELLCQKKSFEGRLAPKTAKTPAAQPGWIPLLGRTAAGIVHYWDKHLLSGTGYVVTELAELVQKHLGREILQARDGALSVDLQTHSILAGIKNNSANLIQVVGDGDQEIVEFIESADIAGLYRDAFALRIDGDSMSPRINDGDIVIVSPSVPAGQGQAAIVRLRNQIGVTCKLVRTADGQVHLIPINEKYETRVVPKADLEWSLAVLCHIRL
jgi:transcriptional regulator with XRE-family HTH domain